MKLCPGIIRDFQNRAARSIEVQCVWVGSQGEARLSINAKSDVAAVWQPTVVSFFWLGGGVGLRLPKALTARRPRTRPIQFS